MILKKRLFKGSRLYLILDRNTCSRRNLRLILKKAIEGGVDLVQLRDKTSGKEDIIRYALPLVKIAKKGGVPFIINDYLDVCLSLDADGLHLGQDDLPAEVARAILGENKLLGLSCHSIADIKKAQKKDVDYLAFGSIFNTKTKPGLHPKGLKALKNALSKAKLPVFAIGGITTNSLKSFDGMKGVGVAVCSQICSSRSPKNKTREIKRLLSKCIKN